MMDIIGGSPAFQRTVRQAISRFPAWFVSAARISKIIVSNSPDVREMIAVYEHGTRNMYLWSGVGALMQRALGHELAHAIDDFSDTGHYFSNQEDWQRIHREQTHFDIPKYKDQPLEYFADMVSKYFLLGSAKLSTTHPKEEMFIRKFVFSYLSNGV